MSRRQRAAQTAILVGVGALGWFAGNAQAQPTTQRMFEAKKACAANQPEKGVDMLAEYYAETGDVMAIYNQGRCYQQNDLHERALSRFREFLRKGKDVPADRRRDAEAHIKELEAEIERKQERERARAAAAAAAGAPAIGTPTGPTPPEPINQMAAPPPPISYQATPTTTGRPAGSLAATRAAPRPSKGLRAAGFALGGVAVAATAAGVYFSTRVGSLQDDVNNAGLGGPTARPASGDTILQKIDDGKQAQTLQWVGYGAAVASAAGAVVCFIMSGNSAAKSAGSSAANSASAPPAPVALAPVIGDQTGYGAALHLTF